MYPEFLPDNRVSHLRREFTSDKDGFIWVDGQRYDAAKIASDMVSRKEPFPSHLYAGPHLVEGVSFSTKVMPVIFTVTLLTPPERAAGLAELSRSAIRRALEVAERDDVASNIGDDGFGTI